MGLKRSDIKVNDRIKFDGSLGTVKNFMPGDMIDIQLDGSSHIERRHISVLAKPNGGSRHDMKSLLGIAAVVFSAIYLVGKLR